MSEHRVDYDRYASEYDKRYRAFTISGIADALKPLAKGRVLEAGCGTGRWLTEMPASAVGLDYSFGMLSEARKKGQFALVHGTATHLPFAKNVFDFVYCVNAIHHFGDSRSFVREAARVGRSVAVVGIEPRIMRGRWWVYEYFPSTFERDLKRFPSEEDIQEWLRQEGFVVEPPRLVERVRNDKRGLEMLEDPFLGRASNSQLALVSDDEYEEGLREVKSAAAAGALFHTDHELRMIYAYRPQ